MSSNEEERQTRGISKRSSKAGEDTELEAGKMRDFGRHEKDFAGALESLRFDKQDQISRERRIASVHDDGGILLIEETLSESNAGDA